MTPPIIAIDGPSGAGKGTVARGVARELGFRHLDTGAMYRATALVTLDRGVDLSDEAAIADLARAARFDLDGTRVVIDGEDVAARIRTPDIDRAAAAVARLPAVRDELVAQQRRLAQAGGVVVEGRDIGTVVFPNAAVKIYLDASPEERARRRASDPAHASGGAGVATVAGALADRDRSDRTRAASPLIVATDAQVIDTTGMAIDHVVARALAIIRATLAAADRGSRPEGKRA